MSSIVSLLHLRQLKRIHKPHVLHVFFFLFFPFLLETNLTNMVSDILAVSLNASHEATISTRKGKVHKSNSICVTKVK